MKFLKPLLFSLLVTCAVQAEEYVLKLSNSMGKHTVAEGCEIEFYADTLGDLWLGKTINGESRGGSTIDLLPNEAVSFYWQKEASTLWTITTSKVGKSTYRKNGSSSEGIEHQRAISSPNTPEAVAEISKSYLAKKPSKSLPGIHLRNIFGQHKLGDISIICSLNTKGEMFIGHEGSKWSSDFKPNDKFTFYYDSDTQKLWTLTSSKVSKAQLDKNRNDSFLLSAKVLERIKSPAKVIELAKELNPSL